MKTNFLLAVSALMVGAPAAAQTSQWQLDPAHSSAQFAVRHMGVSNVRGTFTKLNGTARYDPADFKNDSGDLTIRGITKPVTLDVDGPSKPVKDGQGRLHMGVSATATVNRTDFGMTGYQGIVGK